jgi:hypothetical protein
MLHMGCTSATHILSVAAEPGCLFAQHVLVQQTRAQLSVGDTDATRAHCLVAGASKRKQASTPFADMRSQEGKLGLTLLQKVLLDEEQQQDAGASSSNKPSLDAMKAQLAAAGNISKRLKPKLPGFQKAGTAAAAGAAALGLGFKAGADSDMLHDDDDDEDFDDEDESTPAFQITFDEQGRAVSG